ncbi:MAG: M23 family metallopeptidase [Oscillospiraceae bacterium]|nr:M23 family metallopeptidase [Oscillospiraceae bacterium]
MPNWKLYVTSGIFVLVTVLKLLMPDATAQARQEIVALIDMDMDYRNMITQVGSILTDESVQQVVSRFKGEVQAVIGDDTEMPTPSPSVSVEPSVPATAEVIPTPTLSVSPEPTVTPTPAPTTEIPASVQAAVQAFNLAQEAYVGYETPDTVSYDCLVIPFEYVSPVSGVTSSGFGYRIHPLESGVKFHYGTDFAVETGTPIVAFADGQVTMTGYEKGYGNFVEITHEDGWKTLYAHCSEVNVNWWQQVKRGETIALAGETGEATGPHLHLELTHDGLYTNPEFFF